MARADVIPFRRITSGRRQEFLQTRQSGGTGGSEDQRRGHVLTQAEPKETANGPANFSTAPPYSHSGAFGLGRFDLSEEFGGTLLATSTSFFRQFLLQQGEVTGGAFMRAAGDGPAGVSFDFIPGYATA